MGLLVASLNGRKVKLFPPTGTFLIWLMVWTVVSAFVGVLVFDAMREPARVLWP
jgi:hypothetical protein